MRQHDVLIVQLIFVITELGICTKSGIYYFRYYKCRLYCFHKLIESFRRVHRLSLLYKVGYCSWHYFKGGEAIIGYCLTFRGRELDVVHSRCRIG